MTSHDRAFVPEPQFGQLESISSARDDNDQMAIAIAIDGDDDIILGNAIEYDPNAKPPLYRNRQFCLYGSSAFCVFLATAKFNKSAKSLN